MQATDTERALAFAGILQALKLVQHTAYGKAVDQHALQTSINSIFKLDAESVIDVYTDVTGLYPGLSLVVSELGGKHKKPDIELSRYLLTLLHLERKLGKRADLLDTLQQDIRRAGSRAEIFTTTHENVIASLADCYSATISTLHPRIMVNGDARYLNDPLAANLIRALLLAAMRSAVLWRQTGGTRLGLLFSKRKLAEQAGLWLEKLRH